MRFTRRSVLPVRYFEWGRQGDPNPAARGYVETAVVLRNEQRSVARHPIRGARCARAAAGRIGG